MALGPSNFGRQISSVSPFLRMSLDGQHGFGSELNPAVSADVSCETNMAPSNRHP